MKAKIEKGVLSLRLSDIVDELSIEETQEIARLVCADELIFEAVLECVAEGRFFSDDRDGESGGRSWKARLRVTAGGVQTAYELDRWD